MITPTKPLGQVEFIALMAMMMAMVALAIDAMLPALSDIGRELSPKEEELAQLVIPFFVFGMGLGTLITGPLSDALGRRPVLIGGAMLYAAGSLMAMGSESIDMLVLSRIIMGLGAAGPRVVAIAIVRDQYAGADMARIMSFVMIVFMLVPAIAPAMGAAVIAIWDWRAIFAAFLVFAVAGSLWFALRQPETLSAPDRTPLRARMLWRALVEVLSRPVTRWCILAQMLAFGMLFSVLTTIQPIFAVTFERAAELPMWFALIAVVSALGSFANARLVMRIGMRRVIQMVLIGQIVLTSALILALLAGVGGTLGFAITLLWIMSVFLQGGLLIGNLNAMAMEPLGHVAGMAASVIASLATVGSVLIAVPLGLAFDGTVLPLALGILGCAIAAILVMTRVR